MSFQVPRTRWGGITDHRFRSVGFFSVEQADGAFWLVDPDGGRFLSKGVDTVRFDQDKIRDTELVPYAEACRRKYGGEQAWRRATAERLAGWGFNTLGSWSDEAVATAGPVPLSVTPNLDLGMSFAWQANDRSPSDPRQEFPDVFDPEFGRHVERKAREHCAQRSGDRNLIGWFIDNELRWGPDWRGPDELLPMFLNLSIATPGRIAAINLLRERHLDFEAFNAIWRTPADSWEQLKAVPRLAAPYHREPRGEADRADPLRARFIADCDAFLALLANRYFELTTAAIRAADPNHLVLGCRFTTPPPPAAAIDAAGRHLDVISFNCYGHDAVGMIDAYASTGKPCLIGEFSFRAVDSGLPNSIGAGPLVATQADRASCFRHYVTAALRQPSIVGYHWFEHADQPAQGRFDGEDCNYGMVTIEDRIYEDLTRAMTAVNSEAETLHAAAAVSS
ncbi:MAG: agarase [Rhodopseudomonas sp.]|uniref:agarase n=1 Tax=Rhodopseudomonas sp. TaxID=1078 RepID=UPI001853AA0E|nr:agarase [Rhodopseudomonas sp.]NVN88308.1 agarase [Rhodopseudomonas sp.]